ncbi:MAG: hypothetical protein KAS39_01985, partial [Actinomycetia bacterium]|nr:hypothetical protein [Actinomycetes bacterium]
MTRYKTTVQAKELNSKDFVKYWAKKFREKTGKSFFIFWMRDCVTMKKLMGSMNDKELKAIIDFIFSDNPENNYIKQKGYPIGLLPHSVNSVQPFIANPYNHFSDRDLDLKIPIYIHDKTAYIWRAIKDSDMEALLKLGPGHKANFEFLMARLMKEKGFIPEKVSWF